MRINLFLHGRKCLYCGHNDSLFYGHQLIYGHLNLRRWFSELLSTIPLNNRNSIVQLRALIYILLWVEFINLFKYLYTAAGQAVACAPVTQRARVRSPVGICFLGEVFIGVFPHLQDKCREALGPPRSLNVIWPSLSSIIMDANNLRCWRALKSQIYILHPLSRHVYYF